MGTINIQMREKESLPQGYKASSLGIIPQDWNVLRLGDVCSNNGDYGLNAPAIDYSINMPTYLRITDIDENGKFCTGDMKSVDNPMTKNYYLKDGDIVFARTGATVGKTYLYNKKDGRLVYAGFLIKFSPNDKRILPYYLKVYTETKMYWNWVAVVSQRSGQPGINASEYCSFKMIVPPIEEQKKIAEILSEWDKAIELQTKLIEKLEMRKRALMQRLLTGRVRLNGYREIFGKTTLGKHVVIKKGEMLTSEQYITGPVPVIAGGKFSTGRHNVANRPSRTITISASGANAGFVSFHRCPIFATDCSTIEMSSNYVIEYIYYLLLHHQQQLYFLQSGGAQPHVQPKDIARLKVNYCSDINEQAKMSMILMVADKEIETTKAKLSLFHNQKRALMQQLLTGKQRVRLL